MIFSDDDDDDERLSRDFDSQVLRSLADDDDDDKTSVLYTYLT